MTTEEPTLSHAGTTQAGEWLEPLRDKAIWFSLGTLFVTGLLLAGSPGAFNDPAQHVWFSLSAFFLIGLVLILQRWTRRAAAWALVVGTSLISVGAASLGGVQEAIWLLLLPVGLITLAVGSPSGVMLTVVYSLVLGLAPARLLQIAPTTRAITVIGMWIIVGMLGVAVGSLLSPLQWAWASYEHNRLVLEEALDKQISLQQMAMDLAEANLQLNRLNRLSQALRQTAEDERAAKEQFVANVSHELRTPLNMIIGFCEMITDAPEAYGNGIPPALLADLAVVLRNSHHLSGLINDVLDISQIEAGQMALIKERASLSEIIESAVIAVRPLFDSKGLYMKVDVPADLPLVLCDQIRIREVLLNLLSNTGRFTEHGGVEVRARQDGETIRVSVSDTGPGIDKKHMSRLFQPFEQLNTRIRRRYGGTGLGLSISKNFVELHQGTMWAESEVGKGSTFFFSLPINPPAPLDSGVLRWLNPYEPYEERPRRSRVKPVPFRPRLIVVEDGDSMHRLLSRYLDGVDVVPSTTLEGAFDELARTPAQALVVNDIDIGRALQEVRDAEALPFGVPAIVCSIPSTGQATDALGVFDYLVKPISRQALFSCLDQLPNPVTKVLLVDDEPDALRLFGRMLGETGRGYQVIRASNGKQALALLQQERPDVLLLDLVMPEMDGLQLLAIKSRDPHLRHIPVILISARDPLGQPVLSNSLAVTCRRGMSAREVLACVDALSQILSYGSAPADRALTTTSRD